MKSITPNYSPNSKTISQPYRFELELELVSEQPDLNLQSLLHKPAFLAFDGVGYGIHGQIFTSAQGETGKRLNPYRLSLVPRLSYLTLRTKQRVLQQLTTMQIIAIRCCKSIVFRPELSQIRRHAIILLGWNICATGQSNCRRSFPRRVYYRLSRRGFSYEGFPPPNAGCCTVLLGRASPGV